MSKTKNNLFKIGIVVPCYNEAKRISILEFEKSIIENQNYCFCFVNDGSSDESLVILKDFSSRYPAQIYVIDNNTNLGKAETVRNGINYLASKKKFNIIGFLDADLATPLKEIEQISTIFNNDQKLIVFGSRIKHIGGSVERKFVRYFLGRIFATLVSEWLLKIAVYDTQCGFKFFRNTIIEDIFDKPFRSKWFFDIELFFRIKIKQPNTDINKIAQEFFISSWKDQKGSKIKLFDFLNVPFELVRLKYYYRM